MCYLCMKDNPFVGRDSPSIDGKRKRALEIKALLSEAEDAGDDALCYIGDACVELLRKEQYELARDL